MRVPFSPFISFKETILFSVDFRRKSSAFFPKSDAAKREVVVHNDFKPDNILYDPETKELTAIDYDLVQVGAAVMDFGLPYMRTMICQLDLIQLIE